MQRYEITTPDIRRWLGIRYIGGVGTFDLFWIAENGRMVVKWTEEYGRTCPISPDGAEDLHPLAKINEMMAKRSGPVVTEEEYEVMCAMRKLFVVEFVDI
jgi:hypothetical protein